MQGKYYSLLTNEESKTQKGRSNLCILTKLVSLQTKDLQIHHWVTVQEVNIIISKNLCMTNVIQDLRSIHTS